MAKLKCPDFDGFCMSSSQPLFRVAPYEWCRKNLDGLEVVNDTITLSAKIRSIDPVKFTTDVNAAAEELVILAHSISIDVAIHNQLFSDKPVKGLDPEDIDGFEDAIYPVRPEA